VLLPLLTARISLQSHTVAAEFANSVNSSSVYFAETDPQEYPSLDLSLVNLTSDKENGIIVQVPSISPSSFDVTTVAAAVLESIEPTEGMGTTTMNTFQAHTTFDLGAVNFTLHGNLTSNATFVPLTTVESWQPYYFFGRKLTGACFTTLHPQACFNTTSGLRLCRPPKRTAICGDTWTYYGKVLAPGVYTISAASRDAPSSGQTPTFIVNDC
jgi:hypothetical protein